MTDFGPSFGRRDPDARGYYGEFGGRFVPETLVAPVEELAEAWELLDRIVDGLDVPARGREEKRR
jgi:hypothetical protein